MSALEGRVAIITGAGRGIGREHALLFAAEGAKVVVNDLGAANDGGGSDATPAEEVVAEIRAGGGEAIVNTDNVADWEGAQRLVNSAIDAFGDLDILVNNAGILRDRVLVNMTEQEWDDVIAVHLKGHFAPTRWAASYWRESTRPVAASGATWCTPRRRPGCSRTPGRATTARPSRASPRSARSSPRSSHGTT
jgi:NAD(P)-dependent dehydrogenase (short-subunit alcohol dehydrogenase family)